MTYYAVHLGHNPGIYMTWDAAKKEVDGFPGAVFKGFKNIKDAEYFTVHGSLASFLPSASSAPASSAPASAPSSMKFATLPIKIKIKIKEPIEPIAIKEPIANPLLKLVTKYKSHADYNPASNIVHLYTDGGTIGNGRKDATGGYGVFIPATRLTKERLISRDLVSGKVTNGVAELKAIIKALKEILLIDVEVDSDVELEFVIHYDSTYAADVITGKKGAKANLELVTQGKQLLKECLAIVPVEFEHVYSHTGAQDLHSLGNEIADKLAGGTCRPP